jgi:aminopeptidase N
MLKRLLSLKYLTLPLYLLIICGIQKTWAQREQEKGPQIDVQDYNVEAELIPSSNEIRVKAITKFTVVEDQLSRLTLDFNSSLKAETVYFVDKPPKFSSVPGPAAVLSQTDVPRLTRGARKKSPSSAPSPTPSSDPNQLQFSQSVEDNTLQVDFKVPLARSQTVGLVFEYSGKLNSPDNSPLEGVQVASVNDEACYLLAIGRWFPMSGYMRDRATGNFRITVPQGFIVAMDGTSRAPEQKNGKETFTFVNERPTFPGSLAAARYHAMPVTTGQVEITFYVKDSKRDYINAQNEVVGKILDLFSQKFGAYPSKTLKVAIIDNNSLLGYSAPGIEFLADRAFEATPNGNLLAREISYQWWQSLITPKTPYDLWLKEGFAGYSALLYEEGISSEAGFVRELKDTAVAALLHEEKSTIRNGYQLQEYSPEYNSILKSKGAYVLHMLRGVLGDENFFKLLKEYVYTYGYKEASIEDFKAMAEKISGQNLTYFFSQWIEQNGVPEFHYDYTTLRVKDGFKVTGTIKQDLDTFRMPVEILVETDGKPELKKVEVVGSESAFSVSAFGKPKSARIDPNQKILRISDDLRVATLIAKGDELRKLGEPTEAISEYQKAIEMNKRSSLAFYRIGEVFFAQRSYQSAANSFREALNGDLDPKWLEVWSYINLGKVFDSLNQRERALKEYQKALDTNDNTQGAQEVAQKYTQEPYKYEGKNVVVQ